MSIRTHLATSRQPTLVEEQDKRACSECGGLECLCRPRFFAGQLLTDEDLNRLDRYITAKHRLHNRYLHGWGVVCGLEVLCHPCQGYVTVTAGYALNPCGEDIIVCQDDTVNICDLLQKCRPPDNSLECQPLRPYGATDDCQDLEQEWILAICYEERASRGLMALRREVSGGSCGRCQCGGDRNCRCGCHATANGTHKSANPAPAQCEPTVTCESYRFELRRMPQPPPPTIDHGSLVRRALYTVRDLGDTLPAAPAAEAANGEWYRWGVTMKESYREVMARYWGQNCQALQNLAAIVIPSPQDQIARPAYQAAVATEAQRLTAVMASTLQQSFCAALLPACPPPVADNCVPLASIRLHRGQCRILQVCNTGFRQTAITTAAVQNWLSPLLSRIDFKQQLEQFCCRPIRTETVPISGFRPAAGISIRPMIRAAMWDEASEAKVVDHSRDLMALLAQGWERQAKPLNVYTLLLDALGAVDPEGQRLLSPVERRNPVETVLLNQLILPLIRDFLPGAGLEPGRPPLQPEPAPAPPGATDDIRAEVARLREIIQKQQEQIEALQRGQSGRRARRGGG